MKPSPEEALISADFVRSILHYCPQTGVFTRLTTNNQNAVGSVAGHLEKKTNYVRLTIRGRRHMAHRVAWLYMTGEWPKERIDHKNTVNSDNRFDNLREANDSENSANTKVASNNFIGVKGVRLHECGKYQARICKNGRSKYLGLFPTAKEASAAYERAAKAIFGEFARAA